MIDRALIIVEAAATGAGKHALDVAAGLAAAGTSVDLVYGVARAEPAFVERLPQIGLRNILSIEAGRTPGITDLVALRKVRRFAAVNGPYDVVHGHAGKGGAYARLLPRSAGRRYYTPHAFVTQSPDLRGAPRLAYTAAERLLARRTDGLILVSDQEAAHAEALGLRPRAFTTVPNGITFPPLPARSLARTALNLPADAFIVGYVGRLIAQKGIDLLLDAMPRLLQRRQDAHLAIIGTGEAGPRLRAQAERLGIADHVSWLGHQDGHQAMPAFDLLAMPSRYEGFPYVLLEALWAEVPVLATVECNAQRLLADGAAGRIVERTIEAFGDELMALALDPDERSRMASCAKERVAPYTVESMVARTIEFLSDPSASVPVSAAAIDAAPVSTAAIDAAAIDDRAGGR